MEAIGGYFELELGNGEGCYHKDAIPLNSARNCFEYILIARNYRRVYIPYYTCEVLLQPLLKHHVEYEYYSINERLEPTRQVRLSENEAFFYTNYFGLKQNCIERLAVLYGSQLIVDNAQAFYAPPIKGIDTFYSPRKYFGVPDGGYLYTDCLLEQNFPLDRSLDRTNHLLIRMEDGAEKGYSFFKQADESLDNQSIHRMSVLTKRILRAVDYDKSAAKRRANFEHLHRIFRGSNQLLIECEKGTVPMVYPFYVENQNLRDKLIKEKVFVAQYWPNVLKWCSEDMLEYKLTNHIIALPIDQRYGSEEMDYIIKLLV
ncbi:hypothetical protein [uncultured Bacteroides sp.]|uniref:hypothetical protein n=1 Tax=uncultured Bacteroides sp. TaxID=162156 RepID=UPI00260A09ED|nr:hypothetical protein [uncultured Bacteroides sp.]